MSSDNSRQFVHKSEFASKDKQAHNFCCIGVCLYWEAIVKGLMSQPPRVNHVVWGFQITLCGPQRVYSQLKHKLFQRWKIRLEQKSPIIREIHVFWVKCCGPHGVH